MSANKHPLGGIIHVYQKYDPAEFPSPTTEPPDLVSPAMEHLLTFGNMRELTEEELANAVRLDPRMIANLGPSLEALMEMLRERKRRILETYETDTVQHEANDVYQDQAKDIQPPGKLAQRFQRAVREEQMHDLEQLWFAAGDERSQFARDLLRLTQKLGDKYQIDELASKYEFTGHESMTIQQALEIKRELEKIDELLKQLHEAAKTAQIGVIDMDLLEEFAQPGDVEQLSALQQQIQDYLREMAERQGLEQGKRGGFRITPKAMRIFQGKVLERIFSQLSESRTGRHANVVLGEGATELQATKSYEFGDSVANMDIPQSLVNAMLREASGVASAPRGPVRMKAEDIVIHKTRNNPKCATAVLLDMSGSMRYGGLYVNVKRMGLALEGLIRKEYPGDYLQFVEMYSFAKPRHASEIASLMPKPVTVYDPWVRLKADMSNPNISELQVPPHFTNIQHALQMGRRMLGAQDTPNRQIVLITDGLPTAHFEGETLYLLYPPDRRTEEATLREGNLCARDGITINIFLLSSWNQSREDVRFAYRLAEGTRGRVFFVAGSELDRYVVWDYLERKKQIIGELTAVGAPAMKRCVAILFAVAFTGGPALGQDLAARIGEVISAPEYRHGHWGLLVVEHEKGRVVFERNADELFIPASTTKLYSCSSALDALGSDYRFETPIFARGDVEKGRLHGDLILVASGDLTLGGRTLPDGTLAFTNNDHTYADGTTTTDSLTPTDPLAGLIDLARQVKASGIKTVEGEVLIDDRLFDRASSSGSGPHVVTPIVVNDNVIDVIVTPGSTAGQPAAVSLRPASEFVTLDAQVETTADGRPTIDITSPGFGRLTVRGKVPVGAKPHLRTHAVDDPAAFARLLLIEALRCQGIRVSASPFREPQAQLPACEAYGRLNRVATFKSPPFKEVVKVTLKVSQNLYASTMPSLVAAKHGERTAAAGLRRQREFLKGLGVDLDSVSFAGGAGGERADATSPRATVALLSSLSKRPEWPAIENGLPILGVDGTLAAAIGRDSPAAGHVRAKTGTLWYEDAMNGRPLVTSKALAGTMTTARGKKLIFAMFVNNVPLPKGETPARAGRTLGRLCEIIYEGAD